MTELRPCQLVFCNGANDDARRGEHDPAPLILDHISDKQVRIQLPDFVRSVGTIAPRVLDLIEIASYIFCADRMISRGRPDSLIYDSWSRRFRFVIRVRDESFWSRKITMERLSELLLFITGDREYQFHFLPGHHTEPAHLFDDEEFRLAPQKPHHVMLFSGGLDSLTGAIDRLKASQDIICLVSHRSGLPSTAMTQDRLVDALNQQFPDRVKHYRFRTNLIGKRAAEETQRTRSFLYGTIAFALATALERSDITFYENGITSLNFPRRQDLLNSRASRTTHPRTLFLLSQLLAEVAERPIVVCNPYRWKTKAEVLSILKTHHFDHLIPSAVSCGRTDMTKGDRTHCGSCLQCVDRRFSASAVGLSDVDHAGLYVLDFLTNEIIDGQMKTVVTDYVRLGIELDAETIDGFYQHWLTEIAEAVVPSDDQEKAVLKIHDLAQRFGQQTIGALRNFHRLDDITREPVRNSLLHIIQTRDYLKSDPERLAHKLASKLQRAIPTMFARHPPRNENDFNDKVEALIRGDSDAYRREFPSTMFGTAKVIPDHEISNCSLLIESKYVRKSTTPSKVTDQIASDLVKYSEAAFILFVIYDPNRGIFDDLAFSCDIEKHRPCSVVIIR